MLFPHYSSLMIKTNDNQLSLIGGKHKQTNKQKNNLCSVVSRPSIDMLCDSYEDLENSFILNLQISLFWKTLFELQKLNIKSLYILGI